MKMTNAEAIQKRNSLKELEASNIVIPAIIGFKILQNIHALHDALEPYNQMRDKIIRKHAKGGNEINREKDPVTYSACIREIAEIEQLMIDVDVKKFDAKMLSNMNFPAKLFFTLDFMVEKEE